MGDGNWGSALALLAYAALFSYAYRSLPAGTGALLLFGAVQATMIGHGLWPGERLRARQWFGLALTLAGLVGLMLPGLAAPPWLGALLMLGAGAVWSAAGLGYAVASGALTSGQGYALWYRALPRFQATQAATLQLSVPVIATLAAVPLLGEPLTLRLVLALAAVLRGIALVIRGRR